MTTVPAPRRLVGRTVSPHLYDVVITHSRRVPVVNTFRYRSVLWLVDPDEPPRLPRGLRALGRFRADDHLDIRAELAKHGIRADRLLMLSSPRVLGYVFNPISVFWCYGPSGELVANVAEVHNTYGGRHAYVFIPDERGQAVMEKKMYVSPFYPVDGSYRIRVSDPGEAVDVSVTLNRGSGETFRAGMHGRRRPLTFSNLIRAWIRYPFAPARVRALIQWQGLRLWKGGVEVQPR